METEGYSQTTYNPTPQPIKLSNNNISITQVMY
jgi:hypothetical protein